MMARLLARRQGRAAGSMVHEALSATYKYSGLMWTQERIAHWAGRSFIPILLFHRVTDAIPEDGLTVSTGFFRELCRRLQRHFRVVPLAEAHRLLTGGLPIPLRTVAITFDDGYRDNLFASRILGEHGLPATFFIPTRFVGTDHVFDWDVHVERMPKLSWSEVSEIHGLGHDIGSHGVSHADLAKIGVEQVRRELVDSKREIEERLGERIRWFAYPFGQREHFRPELLPLIYETGYDACFSAFGGFAYPFHGGQVLPRVPVPYFRSVLNLEIHLTGCLDWSYALKRRVGLIST